jgi:hypothetical protein
MLRNSSPLFITKRLWGGLESHPRVLVPRRLFFDKIKAATKAFIANPQSFRANAVTESSKKYAGAESLEAEGRLRPSNSLGFFGQALVKFAIRQGTKFMMKKQERIHDILYSSAQLMEADPRVVAVFGPMVRIEPLTLSNGTQRISQSTVNGRTVHQYELACTVSGGAASPSGQARISASSLGDDAELVINELVVEHGSSGSIVVISRESGNGQGRRVSGAVTIDVKAK